MDTPLARDLVTAFVVALAIVAVYIVRRLLPPEKLAENNEFTGFTWAFVGLVYGVYLAFTVVVVWENFDKADDTATKEATHLSELWRDAEMLPGGHEVQENLYLYAKSVVDDDWPAMGRGVEGSPRTSARYENVWRSYYAVRPGVNDVVHLAFYQQSLTQLNEMGEMRRQRILSGNADLPQAMWFMLIVGGFIMTAFALFIGTPSRWLQISVTAFLTGFMAYAILLVGALEQPFSGDISVKPTAFISVVRSFEQRRTLPRPALP
jgi:hypothetical protein